MNKYLKKFNEIKGRDIYPGFSVNSILSRPDLVDKYAWAIPNKEAIKEICKHGSIIEIGAGGGYWASLIAKEGNNIVAFDNKSTHQSDKIRYWFDVKVGSFEKIKEYPNHTLFLCWPPYENDFAYNCLKHYEGEYLIYVGEEVEGCTANDDFFDEIFENWTLEKTINIPSYGGVYDQLFIYKRRIFK